MIDFYEHIGDYKGGKLAGDVLAQFEKEMAQNEDLKQAVDDYDVAEMALDILLEEDIRNVIKEDDLSHDTDQKVSGIKSYLLFLLGALLIGGAAYFFNQNKGPKHEVLFAEYFTPYMSDDTRGSEDNSDNMSLCDQGHFYLTKKKYFVAKQALQKSITVGEKCAKTKWYLALEYLREENYEECRSLLEEIINDESSPYKSKASKLVKKI